MPLPLAHTIVGYSAAAMTGVRFRRNAWTAVLFSVVVANLPDLDFLPGALANEPVKYHRTIAHTLPAALVVAFIIAAILTRFRRRFGEIFILAFLVYSSHLFADMFNFMAGNIGVQILWPFSEGWYTIRTPFENSHSPLLNFSRGSDASSFLASFFSWQFIRAMMMQALLFSPFLLFARWFRSYREKTG
jgi:membrane-bound metal-dependent hydrolase YbcI (DUF457 family)